MAKEKMVKVTIELSVETIASIAIMAHEADMKFNDYINKILKEYINKTLKVCEYIGDKLPNSDKMKDITIRSMDWKKRKKI